MARTNKTVPYREKQQLEMALDYLGQKHDVVYVLLFEVLVYTGLRISDVCGLKYHENLRKGMIVLDEGKGTKMAIAKARNRVFKEIKDTLIALAEDKTQLAKLIATPTKDIYELLPETLQPIFDKKLAEAEKNAPVKHRECVIPDHLYKKLKARQRKFKGQDGGYIFAANCVKWTKAKEPKPMNRKTVWRVFSEIGKKYHFDFATNCHQLRKTYAVMLYESSGNNGSLVINEIGWSDDKYLKTYLAIEKEECNAAVKAMQDKILN